MARNQAPTQSETVNTDNDLGIEAVEWQSGAKKEPHPQIVTMLRQSWDNRTEQDNGKVDAPAYRLNCDSEEAATKRAREIRDAGTLLGIGVGIRRYVNAETGKHEVHFRAKRKRAASGATAVNGATAEA